MGQKVLVQLVDDLDGSTSDDVTTVQFGLDGVTYEIDLTEQNAERLRDSLSDYVGSGRRTGGRIKRGTRPAGSSNNNNGTADASKIRDWAQQNGFELAGRGRIPKEINAAYHRAQEEEKATAKPAAKPAAKKRVRSRK